jgi:putative ABC transport system ATP-binding protein
MNAPLLSARDLTVVFPGDEGDVCVIDGVSLDLGAGEILDVVGPSGTGKTTLLRALARLLPGCTGELSLRGHPAEELAPSSWRAEVALLPQKPAIVDGSVRDNLVLPWRLKVRDESKAPADLELEAAMDGVGLGRVSLDRDASRLSIGQQARVALLRVVLAVPTVLLLDEPDASLDDDSAEQVARMTAEFAAAEGGVVRVRHPRSDDRAPSRMRLTGGKLAEVAA